MTFLQTLPRTLICVQANKHSSLGCPALGTHTARVASPPFFGIRQRKGVIIQLLINEDASFYCASNESTCGAAMIESLSIIKLDDLRSAPLRADPFPFVVIENFLRAEYAQDMLRDFPMINSRGSFPLKEVKYGKVFDRLVEELKSSALKSAIAEKFNVDLNDRYTMITVRGVASERDGRIHTDTKSKFLTMLLYLNPIWEAEGGWLRILRSGKNLDDYVAEIPPTFGSCLLFKVTDNCWHGHKPFKGTRKVLQLNYVRDEASLNRHLLRHSVTAKLKSLREHFMKAAG